MSAGMEGLMVCRVVSLPADDEQQDVVVEVLRAERDAVAGVSLSRAPWGVLCAPVG